jgi:hypothetical protein
MAHHDSEEQTHQSKVTVVGLAASIIHIESARGLALLHLVMAPHVPVKV